MMITSQRLKLPGEINVHYATWSPLGLWAHQRSFGQDRAAVSVGLPDCLHSGLSGRRRKRSRLDHAAV